MTRKFYTPIDMTDQNKIVNLGTPTDVLDAATKSYVDNFTYQDPLRVAGDLVYESSAGTKIMSSQPAQQGWNGYVGVRVIGLTQGHTIHVAWESNCWGSTRLRTFMTNGSTVIQDFLYGDTGGWVVRTQDVVLGAGETEMQLFASPAWADPANTVFKNILYTDLTATAPAKLPIGTSGQVLTVANGVPTWQTTPSGWFGNDGADGEDGAMGPPGERGPIGLTGPAGSGGGSRRFAFFGG